MRKTEWLLLAFSIITIVSCSKDKFEVDICEGVSYNTTISPLIHAKCAVSGCHVSGFLPGDFTRYDVVKQKVSDGKLQLMVFSLNIMPPVNKLTDEEKLLLKCWIEGGAEDD